MALQVQPARRTPVVSIPAYKHSSYKVFSSARRREPETTSAVIGDGSSSSSSSSTSELFGKLSLDPRNVEAIHLARRAPSGDTEVLVSWLGRGTAKQWVNVTFLTGDPVSKMLLDEFETNCPPEAVLTPQVRRRCCAFNLASAGAIPAATAAAPATTPAAAATGWLADLQQCEC